MSVELVTHTTAPGPDTATATGRGNDLREVLGERLEAAEVPRRLRATAGQDEPKSWADPQRQFGFDIGVAWAQRRASLDGLLEVAHIDDQDWSSIVLPEGFRLLQAR